MSAPAAEQAGDLNQQQSGEPRNKGQTSNSKVRNVCDAVGKKFVIFINPKLMTFNRPILLAGIIGITTLILFTVLLYVLLGQCQKSSYTATTRSEMLEWLSETSSVDPMNNWNQNWKCLHYTAKLGLSSGSLGRSSAISKTEPMFQFVTSPNLRYEKCDLGVIQYRRKDGKPSPSQVSGGLPSKVAAYDTKDNWESDGVWVEGEMIPERTEEKAAHAWVRAGHVHQVPGGINELDYEVPLKNPDRRRHVGMNMHRRRNPMYEFLHSRPWKDWNGQVLPNDYPFAKNYDICTKAGDCTFYPDFNFSAAELNDDNIEELLANEAVLPILIYPCTYEIGGVRCTRSAKGVHPNNRSMESYKFRLKNKMIVDQSEFEPDSMKTQGRHLKRSMFCKPSYFDDMILSVSNDPLCLEMYGEDHHKCTKVRRCDMTGYSAGESAWIGGETVQPEYGSFLVVYEKCPALLDTLGAALGYVGQIEMVLTIFFIFMFLICGCVRVEGDQSNTSFASKVQGSAGRAMFAVDEGGENQESSPRASQSSTSEASVNDVQVGEQPATVVVHVERGDSRPIPAETLPAPIAADHPTSKKVIADEMHGSSDIKESYCRSSDIKVIAADYPMDTDLSTKCSI